MLLVNLAIGLILFEQQESWTRAFQYLFTAIIMNPNLESDLLIGWSQSLDIDLRSGHLFRYVVHYQSVTHFREIHRVWSVLNKNDNRFPCWTNYQYTPKSGIYIFIESCPAIKKNSSTTCNLSWKNWFEWKIIEQMSLRKFKDKLQNFVYISAMNFGA